MYLTKENHCRYRWLPHYLFRWKENQSFWQNVTTTDHHHRNNTLVYSTQAKPVRYKEFFYLIQQLHSSENLMCLLVYLSVTYSSCSFFGRSEEIRRTLICPFFFFNHCSSVIKCNAYKVYIHKFIGWNGNSALLKTVTFFISLSLSPTPYR